MSTIEREDQPGQTVIDRVAGQWRLTESCLDSMWRALGHAVLSHCSRALASTSIPCSLGHGDFAPWNTRVEGDRLFVFDWESAARALPSLWDVFHFHVQTASLLRPIGRVPLGEGGTVEIACLLLYLLSSVCRLREDGVHPGHAGLMYRRRLISEKLSEL